METNFTNIVAEEKKTAIQRMRGMLFNIKREYNLTDAELAKALDVNEDFLYDFMREKYNGEVPFDFVVKMHCVRKTMDEVIISRMPDNDIDKLFINAKSNVSLHDKIEKLLDVMGIRTEEDIDNIIRNANKGTDCHCKGCENKSHKEEKNDTDDEDELPEGTCGYYCTRDKDGNIDYHAINYNDLKDFLETIFGKEK